ncbi:hypothetical protein [uncultured Sphingomonas sp.]|uniref:hypothetical protein n=1 Tax=uncultured Sphingomonas sp. TaxID=158754 RepID=UPI0025EA1AA3|nr:hypothetical protein [uncultured Sphingomonas sp.]
MRHSLRDPARIATTLFPVEDARRDWTETAALILVAIGAIYFVAHFAVAYLRGPLS